MSDEKVKSIRLVNITVDESINPRAGGLNAAHVADLEDAIESGDELPPLVLYQNSANTLLLSEGFHRAEAYKRKSVKAVPCVIRKGERKDALANACGSNRAHGLKRSNADKRRAVELLVAEFPAWSNRRIAEAAGVSHEFVNKVRPTEPGEQRQGADGRTQTIQQSQQSNTRETQVATVASASRESSDESAEIPIVGAQENPGSIPLESLPEDAEAAEDDRQKLHELASEKLAKQQSDPGAEFVATVETLCREMDQVAAKMKALKVSPLSYSMHIDSAVAQVEAARKTLWQGRPAHTCPYCKGEGCKTCNQTGRVKKTTFDSGTAAVGDAA